MKKYKIVHHIGCKLLLDLAVASLGRHPCPRVCREQAGRLWGGTLG